MDIDEIIKIKANDGGKIEMSKKAAMKSSIIKGILEDYPDNDEIPLNNVNSTTFEKIKDYLVHYQDKEPQKIEIPLKSNVFKECVDDWDYGYLGEDIDQIFDILNAANYLDIKPLMELASAKLGSKLKGLSSESIKKDFDIPPLTQEEREQILKDKKFLETHF